MSRRGAKTIGMMKRYRLILAWLVALCSYSSVCADPLMTSFSNNTHFTINDRLLLDIECSERHSSDAVCGFKTDMQYSKYLNSPLSAHERYLFSANEQDQRNVDLFAILKLALEEFKFLSNVKLYWKLTEKGLEALAIKLRLKGEIPISDVVISGSTAEKKLNGQHYSTNLPSTNAGHRSGALSLFKPSILQWNIRMNPNNMTVFGELNLNAYLTLSGEFGDTNQVGVYFRYAF
jgi:hypothetical protein